MNTACRCCCFCTILPENKERSGPVLCLLYTYIYLSVPVVKKSQIHFPEISNHMNGLRLSSDWSLFFFFSSLSFFYNFLCLLILVIRGYAVPAQENIHQISYVRPKPHFHQKITTDPPLLKVHIYIYLPFPRYFWALLVASSGPNRPKLMNLICFIGGLN